LLGSYACASVVLLVGERTSGAFCAWLALTVLLLGILGARDGADP
jgi:hypothetical protein